MSDFRNFVYYPMEKPKRIQPDSPVYIHAYTLAVQQQTGASFVQIRMVNRSDRVVHSVFLHVVGLDPTGRHSYEISFLPLPGCHAQPHCDFGEDHVLFLPESSIRHLEIWVEDVLFDDGMIWRKQAKDQLLTPEQAGWTDCDCGMKNPQEADCCAFCGKILRAPEQKSVEEAPVPFFTTAIKPITSIEQPKAIPAEPEEAPVLCEPEAVAEPAPVAEQEEEDAFADFEPLSWEAEIPVPYEQEPVSEPEPVAELPEEDDTPASELTGRAEPVTKLSQNQMDLLAQILAPLRDRMPEESSDPDSEDAEQEAFLQEDGFSYMEETNQLMQEMQRRMLARQRGEPVQDHEESETPEEEEIPVPAEDGRMKRANRGIMFWSLMVIIMILLLLGGFFGILSFKGYFS